ncbi:pentatricopeptide repeat-containing protein [Pyrus ussuriensis x Pyrus communis]|uniref:Pentatricopeptide repeat-containing protein n=1 Tax=Pyrus ussuriensis x Pyrus communis TaxID=2448454 RepID=A0A5N5HN60_9ROSA|nr:pentatricopeptide repeat-containing protein [Pyrus ussuriensis x Pyrus communis]
METLWTCLLPSNPLFAQPSLSQKPSNSHKPKFKFQASTATTCVSTTATLSNPANQQTHISFPAKISNNPIAAQPSSEIGRFLSLLKSNPLSDCRQIHAQALKLEAFEANGWVRNKLAMLYSKSDGFLDHARKMFNDIPQRTVPTYGALISAYCRSEQWEDLFLVFELMIDEGMMPDKYVVPTVLKACAQVRMLRTGKMIHGLVIRNALDSDVFVGNALIDFYANCGDLGFAMTVFDAMRETDVVSWTALVSAFMNEGLFEEAMEVFKSMQVNGVEPDLISWNALVSGFARNGETDLALQYLKAMQEEGLKPRVSTWNGIISGCVQNSFFVDALDAFNNMLCFPEDPNSVTIASILPSCAGLKDLNLGRAVHGFALKRQLCENVYVEGSLIDMYSKCGMNDYAERIFSKAESKSISMWNEMVAAYVNAGEANKGIELLRVMHSYGIKPDVVSYNTILADHARNGQINEAYELLYEMVRMDLKPNIISFNVLISGFQQFGLSFEALKVFQTMQSPSSGYFGNDVLHKSVQPNSITIAGALAACADLNLLCQGKEIHGYTLKTSVEPNIYISSALIDMYSKCHDIASAAKVFRRTDDKNTICWNALIAGHVNNKQLDRALELFGEMLEEGLGPSSVTLMTLLLTCGDLEALRFGRELHGHIIKSHLDQSNFSLASALVGMYAKCGSIKDAKSVFDFEVKGDVSVWNSMLSANLTNGTAKKAIALFRKMQLLGVEPEV